jgi:glucosyl-3-phosphoglycerate synthase
VARQLGADVYEAANILPGQGALHGRGECWWKSLAVLRGDIVVWLDVRARRFHPSTALSLAGPLLRVPTLQLVKDFGQIDGPEGHREKPGRQEADEFSLVDMSWGGFVVPRREAGGYGGQVRVQALKPSDLESLSTAQIAMLPLRTLVQVLAPGLAGVVAPFGRDLAARREAMLSLPVFAGENLELGLLLSAAAEYGTNAIAQIELRQGQPGPPPAPGLRNAMDVLQVLARRLPEGQYRKAASSTAERLQKELEGRRPSPGDAVPAIFEVRALGPVERPPMNKVFG